MYKNGAWDFSPPDQAVTFSNLLEDLLNAMMLSHIASEGKGEVVVDGNTIRITTHFCSDPDSSRTGGDYNYYRRFALKDGVLVAWSDWSCDFADYGDYDDPNSREYNLNSMVDDNEHYAPVFQAMKSGNLQVVADFVKKDMLEFYERVVRYHLNS